MKVRELKEFLENCKEDLEVELLTTAHTHLYDDVRREVGLIDHQYIVPLNSISIKNNDGYGHVILTNMNE